MKVEFTDPAEESLRKIYCRHTKEVAKKIIERILLKAGSLSTFSKRGRIVEELRSLNQEHRYILEGNYKIIYRQHNDMVFVTDVFYVRQDPNIIRERHQQ